jgi:prefoldin subunit 5
VYNTPDGKKIEETMRQLYQAKEAARIGAALSVHIENLLSKVMTSLGPLGNHVSKKDGYEQAVKETIRVYDELLEKLSGSVKQKAIDNLSQRIIQLRQTVHVSNFSSEFYPVAGDHLEVDGVEKKK